MRLIDGRAIAAALADEVAAEVGAAGAAAAGQIAAEQVTAQASTAGSTAAPTLAVLVPTADEATASYVRSIERAAARVGIRCLVEPFRRADRDALADRLDRLSADPGIHGIICQTPLPAGVSLAGVGAHIDPAKDVDGANPASLGRLAAGLPAFAPATAAAVLQILHRVAVPLAGARAVVVGRSTVVGKPLALLLLAEHATVTICHSRTRDLVEVCAGADVLVAAAGRAHLLGADHIRPGAVVIDVGTNVTAGGGLAGDVDPAGAGAAAALTPVPGGVGPVTAMILMRHVARAAARATRAETAGRTPRAGRRS